MTDVVRKRLRPAVNSLAVVGGDRDLAILGDLAWAGVLATGQLERLHFTSRRRAQRRLRALMDQGYVRAHLQGDALHCDNVYTLAPLGLDLLAERGRFPAGAPKLLKVPATPKLRHALLARDVFVEFRCADRDEGLELRDFRFEGDLARETMFRTHGIIPDALAVIGAQDGTEVFVPLEVDRGTETTTTLRAKFAKWRQAFLTRGGVFAAAATTLLIVAPTVGRVTTLERLVTETELIGMTMVMMLDQLATELPRRWAHLPGVTPGRAERPAIALELRESHAIGESGEAAFRPLGRVQGV